MRKKVILLSGKLQSGKNASSETIFEYLNANNKSNKHLFFAKALKDGCKDDFQVLKEYLNSFIGNIILKYSDVNYDMLKEFSQLRLDDSNFYENKTELSRILLQTYGTDIFRNRVNTNHWVDTVVETIQIDSNEYFVLTDVRFPNEIEHLEDRLNGITSLRNYDIIKIRVNRDISRNGVINDHPSESALDTYNKWDYVIDNNSDLNELKNKTNKIIKEIVDEKE